MEPKTKSFEPLKIRLSEGLDARLRSHAEKTGATLNSIICLAIDAFLPDEVLHETAPAPVNPEKVVEATVLTPKRPTPVPPKFGPNPTKAQRNKLEKWHREYGSNQGDLSL